MKNLKKVINLTCMMIFCFLLLSPAESKAQVIKLSDKDLTERSTAVLYGRCSKVKSEWNDKKDLIFTQVTVVPEEYIKGNLGSEAVITVPGGQVGDILYEVSEMPVFIEGEEVVAFVWTNPAGKNLITGGYQGKMKIERDKKTGKRIVQEAGAGILASGQVRKLVMLEDFVVKLKGWAKN
jgi:hypothetical protein